MWRSAGSKLERRAQVTGHSFLPGPSAAWAPPSGWCPRPSRGGAGAASGRWRAAARRGPAAAAPPPPGHPRPRCGPRLPAGLVCALDHTPRPAIRDRCGTGECPSGVPLLLLTTNLILEKTHQQIVNPTSFDAKAQIKIRKCKKKVQHIQRYCIGFQPRVEFNVLWPPIWVVEHYSYYVIHQW